jgi:hypothetical protein
VLLRDEKDVQVWSECASHVGQKEIHRIQRRWPEGIGSGLAVSGGTLVAKARASGARQNK